MLTKVAFALVLVVALVASDPQREAREILSHYLIVGARQYGDSLLRQEIVMKNSGRLQIKTLDIRLTIPHNRVITQVKALDQKTNGKGAYASITNGGPGNRDVTLHFKSQRGHSINFIVEIYGR